MGLSLHLRDGAKVSLAPSASSYLEVEEAVGLHGKPPAQEAGPNYEDDSDEDVYF